MTTDGAEFSPIFFEPFLKFVNSHKVVRNFLESYRKVYSFFIFWFKIKQNILSDTYLNYYLTDASDTL